MQFESRILKIKSQIESQRFKSNLQCSNKSQKCSNRDLNQIAIWICPSLLVCSV